LVIIGFTFEIVQTKKDVMKKLFKSKIAFLIVIGGLLFSCKTNNSNSGEESLNRVDSTETSVDTVNSSTDTINGTGANGAGTTGATGEGSTGSGSDGTTQKGNTSVRTDSTSTGTGGGK